VSAWRIRAVAGLRRRPAATASAALGLLLAGTMLGAATTTGLALASGFDRAQRAAGTADVIARFHPVQAGLVARRLRELANLRSFSLRLTVSPVPMAVRSDGSNDPLERGRLRFGSAQVDGLEAGHLSDGLAIVSGRGLSGRPGEAVVEQGLASAWHLRPGMAIGLCRRASACRAADIWTGRIVGIAVEPDNVAFPLASRPRIYMPYDQARAHIAATQGVDGLSGPVPVNAAYLRVVDLSRLPETLVQARTISYGLTGLTFVTGAGIRTIVDSAGGLVVSLLSAFAIVALVAALVMLAAAGHARVTRELPTIGALRTIGFTPSGLALSYAAETLLAAVPALAFGVVAGSLLVATPTDQLLRDLNELPPGHVLGPAQLAVTAAAALLAGAASAAPVLAAARRPIVETLRGATMRQPRPRRATGVSGRPLLLGARLALARPARLAATSLAIAAALATIFLMLSLARFLLAAERDPSAIGERYSLLVRDTPGALDVVRSTPGVAAAADRWEINGADAFDLGQPMTIVAFGEGGSGVFSGRPLLDGRRASHPGEAEVGRGLALSLGLAPGSTLLVQLPDGGELRLHVSGIVQELSHDGRVAYTDGPTLLAARSAITSQIAVRPAAGVSTGTIQQRLAERGLSASASGGLAPAGAPFLGTVVTLLRTVAVIDGLVCVALVLLALVVIARERAPTIAVLRTVGGTQRAVAALLFGAAAAQLLLALPVAYAVERWLLGPRLSGLVARYGALPLAPTVSEVLLVAGGATAGAILTALAAAGRYGRVPVVDALRVD
jgi:hypothetical protein